MKLTREDLVNNVKSKIPNISKRSDDKIIKKIINTAIEEIHEQIVNSEDEKVVIPKLGRFVKREIGKDGKKMTRILFFAAKTPA